MTPERETVKHRKTDRGKYAWYRNAQKDEIRV
jgi:hypothetical protein